MMDQLLPLASFALAATITPGPNNLMLAASGVAFGFRRTIPHMLGILVGFSGLITVSALGVGSVVDSTPQAALALKIAGSVYLLYLTWIMRRAFDINTKPEASAARPFRFLEAATFQFANPKAWLITLTAMSVFVPARASLLMGLFSVWGAFMVLIVPSGLAWVGLGVAARRSFVNERWRSVLGIAIVALMLYSVVGIWLQEYAR